VPYLSFSTPVGDLKLFQAGDALVAIEWGRTSDDFPTLLLEDVRAQLDAYFDGALNAFDLPLRPAGTPFQQRVWRQLPRIPYGATATYGDVAKDLQTSPRAVGAACARNPLPIVIPCHRVVGAGHGLVGFSGGYGLETKSALLSLENAFGFSNLVTRMDR
jgi:methylated-DNA-[protein]-cysteine S-methyltransferase